MDRTPSPTRRHRSSSRTRSPSPTSRSRVNHSPHAIHVSAEAIRTTLNEIGVDQSDVVQIDEIFKNCKNQGSHMYKHKGHKTQKCSLLCLYKTQIWFCALWFCGTKMNENPCVFVFFRVVFGVRYKHKTSF